MHDYALLTTAGLESVALDALASECGLRASALPAPTARKGESFGSAGGLGILVASRQEPLAACALSAPVLQAALAVVVRCEVEDGDVLAAAVGSVSEERWRSAMRTHAAHAAPLPPSAPSFRIASLRAGQHDFDSRALSSALGAAVSALQPSWRVDLEAPDVCVLALLVNRSLLIGALLPPFSPRKSDPLPMEPRQWLVRGERAHMRPHRAALLARLLAPADGEVLLDPTGGVGILAIEAALLASVTAHSVDLDPAACDSARANAAAAAPRLRGRVTVHCGDAARLGGEVGLPRASVDCVLADLPFGMLHARLDVGALLSALAVLVRPGGRCLLVGNAGPGGVAAAVVKASRRYPPGAWRVVRQTACASGGIACEAVQLARLGEAAPRLGRLEKARGKVVLEPGFGLAAWLRLSRGADLTGGVGPLDEEEEEAWPKWSLADVASHTTPEDSWMAVRGKVYNVSPYLRYHPGGVDTLLDAAGTDATALFQQHHAWVNEDMLSACCVGTLRQ